MKNKRGGGHELRKVKLQVHGPGTVEIEEVVIAEGTNAKTLPWELRVWDQLREGDVVAHVIRPCQAIAEGGT